MYSYIIGKVTEQNSTYVVIENNNIGYTVYVANPYSYEIDKDIKIYLYQYIREDENTLYGFKTKEEKDLFLKLISVKGIGPKLALPMFAVGSISGITDAIERENILYLTKFPKIGEKVAKQIILDLKGKLATNMTIEDSSLEELKEVLKGLGYKEKDIKTVVGKVDTSLKLEDQVKESLKLLLK